MGEHSRHENTIINRLMFYNWRITGFQNMEKILFLLRLGDFVTVILSFNFLLESLWIFNKARSPSRSVWQNNDFNHHFPNCYDFWAAKFIKNSFTNCQVALLRRHFSQLSLSLWFDSSATRTGANFTVIGHAINRRQGRIAAIKIRRMPLNRNKNSSFRKIQ